MYTTRAYRFPVDGAHYAVIHALDELEAQTIFKKAFPEHAVILTHASWEDGQHESGHVDLRKRLFNMSIGATHGLQPR